MGIQSRTVLVSIVFNLFTKVHLIVLAMAIALAIPGSAQLGPHKGGLRVISIVEMNGSGMCIGYCMFELRITGTKIRYRERAFPDNRKSIPDRIVQDKISKEEWNQLLGSFDIADFRSLPERIGCPGCVDEITQSIEISFSNGTKKSVFYNSGGNPASIADLVAKIDSLESSMRRKIKRKYPNRKPIPNPD